LNYLEGAPANRHWRSKNRSAARKVICASTVRVQVDAQTSLTAATKISWIASAIGGRAFEIIQVLAQAAGELVTKTN